ncbi:YidB family protein [Crenobacter luteus]|nr:YidB family protein [Crenobacter luteus]
MANSSRNRVIGRVFRGEVAPLSNHFNDLASVLPFFASAAPPATLNGGARGARRSFCHGGVGRRNGRWKMTWLDSLRGALGGDQGALAGAVAQLLQDSGGLEGLLDKLRQGGLSEAVASWLGSGDKLPVTAEQIESVLGNETIAALAGKAGLDPQQLAAGIADYLPQLVDKLSPDGTLPAGGDDLLGQGLDALKGLFRR